MANEIVVQVKIDTKGFNLDAVNRSLDRIGENARQASDHVSKGFNRARDSMGRFVRAGESVTTVSDRIGDVSKGFNRARDSMGRFVRAGESVTTVSDRIGDGVRRSSRLLDAFSHLAATGMQAAGSAAARGLSMITSGAAQLAALIPIATGAFLALAPALLAAGGAAGAAATAFVGAASAVAVLGMGFGGIGDALSAHTKMLGAVGGAAKGAGDQEHQAAIRIRDASRAVVDAKRNEAEAIKDVNRARMDEVQRLKDLDSEIRGQTISQEEAAQALEEAKLDQAKLSANATDREKREAQTRVDRAQYEYDETVRRLKMLTDERKKADKVGVDGSEQVQAALQRQARAHEQVIRTQEQLAEAQRKVASGAAGGGAAMNAFDDAMKKLSPNAQALVRTLISLSDRWSDLKKRVQDRLLAGAAEDTRVLATKWLPALDEILGKMADRLNAVGRGIARAFGQSSFIENMKKASDEGGKFISTVGGGLPALIDGFGKLAANSGPVLQVIGKAIRGIFEWFDRWISSAEKSGALQRFMKTAAEELDKIFHIAGQVFRILGQFVEILFPSSKKASDSVLDSVSKQLEAVSVWLKDPENQKAIQRIADKVGDFIGWLVSDAIPVIISVGTFASQMAFKFVKAWDTIRLSAEVLWLRLRGGWLTLVSLINNQLIRMIDIIDSTFGKIIPGLHRQLDGAKKRLTQFRKDTNNELDKIKDRTIRITYEQVGANILQVAVNAYKAVTGKATGGIKGAAASGGPRSGLTWVGEHGPELAELAPGARVYSNPDSMRMASGGGQGGGPLRIHGTMKLSADSALERGVVDALFKLFRVEIGTFYGGDVQLALGK